MSRQLTSSTAGCRRGNGLLSALFAIIVIVLLLALYLSAVSRSRDGGNRANTCRNNMRNVALSLMQYENTKGEYPALNTVVSIDGQEVNRPLMFHLLPYLERNDIYRQYVDSPTNIPADEPHYLKILICPSDFQTTGAPTSYVFNSGLPNTPGYSGEPVEGPDQNTKNNGVIFSDRRNGTSNSAYITGNDGMEQTLLVSENVAAGTWDDGSEIQNGFVWHDVPPDQQPLVSINARVGQAPDDIAPDTIWSRPSSKHPGGVNMAFADAHVSFINNSIQYLTYAQLMTSAGKRAGVLEDGEIVPPLHVKVHELRPYWDEEEGY